MGFYQLECLDWSNLRYFGCIVATAKDAEIHELRLSQAKCVQYVLQTDVSAVIFAIESSYKERCAKNKRIDVFSKDTLNQSFASKPCTLRFSLLRSLNDILPH